MPPIGTSINAVDPDATRVPLQQASFDPDATVVRVPQPEADLDPDATVVRVPAADADATVVRVAQILPLASVALPQLTLQPGFRLHEYRIDAVLGQGGFGVTYLATDVNLRALVAIKEYLPAEISFRAGDHSVSPNASEHRDRYRQGLEAFLVEARTLAGFRHPAIVRVARFFEAHRTAYMVLEYEAGQSLKAWWPAHRHIGEARLVERLQPLLDGLAVVHAAGVLHRDIKPDNVQVRSNDGSLVLLDFGSAGQSLVVPDAQAVIVTPGYAPPEQYGLGSEATQGPWTDIYALGATLYWLVTGRKPPDAELRLHGQPMPSARELGQGRFGAAFLGAIDEALALDPAARPRDIAKLRQKLLADHLGTLALADALQLHERQAAGGGGGRAAAAFHPRALLARFNPARWSLATKLTLAFVLTALVPMAVAGLFNLRHSLAVVTAAEVENLEHLARSVAGRLAQLVNDTRATARGLGTDRDIAAFLARPDEAAGAALRERLQRLSQAKTDLKLVLLLGRDGATQLSSGSETAVDLPRLAGQVNKVVGGAAFVSGITVGAEPGTTGVTFAEPVRDETQAVVGVVLLRLHGAAVAKILDEARAEDLTPMLVDSHGVVQHHPRQELLFRSLRPLPEEALAAVRGDQRYRRDEIEHLNQPVLAGAVIGTGSSGNVAYRSSVSGVDEVAGFAPVPGHDWVVVVSETRAAFEEPLARMYHVLLASLALLGLLATGLALRFARSIVRPVQALTRAADALKTGDFDAAHVDVPRSDELGQLARTFNVMTDVLRQREREKKRSG